MTVIDPYEHPDNVDAEVASVVEEAAPEYTDLNLQRRFRVIFAIGIAGLLLMGWLLIRAATSSDELDSLRERNETLTKTNELQQLLIDKLATQLDEAIDQGAAVPEPEIVAAEVPGAEVSPPVQGERGDAGAPGETGSSGAVGSSGLPGSVGEQGDVGPRGLPGVAGADGSAGSPGASGSDGSPGSDGVDGAPGASGTDGTPGQPGADGAPGAQGPTGPAPQTMMCTPTNPLDLSQPWSCVVTS